MIKLGLRSRDYSGRGLQKEYIGTVFSCESHCRKEER